MGEVREKEQYFPPKTHCLWPFGHEITPQGERMVLGSRRRSGKSPGPTVKRLRDAEGLAWPLPAAEGQVHGYPGLWVLALPCPPPRAKGSRAGESPLAQSLGVSGSFFSLPKLLLLSLQGPVRVSPTGLALHPPTPHPQPGPPGLLATPLAAPPATELKTIYSPPRPLAPRFSPAQVPPQTVPRQLEGREQ